MAITGLRISACFGAVVVAAVSIATFTSVRAGVDDPAKNPMAAENVQRGEKLYTASCSFCHGATAKGATGPSLIDSAVVRHDKDGNMIAPIIHEGRMARGMPGFPQLNDQQVSDIVAYLHARIAATDSRETAGPRAGYQMQKLLSGSADAGKTYFNGEGGCAGCHSVTGDLAKVATRYQPTELEGKILYPRGKASTAVVTLKGGKTVEGTLQHIDPFYVAVTMADGSYHSWDRDAVKVQVKDPLQGHLTLLAKYSSKDVHDLFAYLETIK